MTPPDSQLDRYVAHRESAAVHLRATDAQATRLARDLAPYVPLTFASAPPTDDEWTIRPTTPGDQRGTAVSQPGIDRRDAGYRLWLDAPARTLHVAPAPVDALLLQYRRLVRAVLRRTLAEHGALHLHAALVVSRTDDTGSAILGPTRAGKTTLLLALLLSGHFAGCVHDDLTVLAPNETRPHGLGWPRAVSVRRDTLRRLAAAGSPLRDALADARHPSSGYGPGATPLDHRAWLFPDELARATASPLHPRAPIHRLIFLNPGATTEPALTPLAGTDDTVHQLRAHLQASATRYEPWLDPHFTTPSPAELDRRLHTLAERTSAFQLTHSLADLPVCAALLASDTPGQAHRP